MRNPSTFWIALLMIAAAVSGCMGGDDAGKKEADPSQGGNAGLEITNGIEGTIQTEDLFPLGQAKVEILSLNLSVLTNGEGKYRFVNLQPRDYLVVAQMDGYKTKTQRAIVAEGKIHQLDFTLEERPLLSPYSDYDEFSGMIVCKAVIQTDPENQDHRDCGGGTGEVNTSTHEFTIDPNAAQIVVEAFWTPAQDAAEQLQLTVESVGFGHQDLVFGSITGPNGIRVVLPQSIVEKYYPAGGVLRTSMRAGASITGDEAGIDAGFALAQQYTVFVTVFFVEPGPPNFSQCPQAAC